MFDINIIAHIISYLEPKTGRLLSHTLTNLYDINNKKYENFFDNWIPDQLGALLQHRGVEEEIRLPGSDRPICYGEDPKTNLQRLHPRALRRTE